LIYQTYTSTISSDEQNSFRVIEVLFKERKLNKSLQLIYQKLRDFKEEDEPEKLIYGKFLLASILLKKSEYVGEKNLLKECKKTLIEVLEICKKVDHKRFEGEAYLLLSETYKYLDQSREVRTYLKKATEVSELLQNEILSIKCKTVSIDHNIRINNFDVAYDLAMITLTELLKLEDNTRAEFEANVYLSLVRIFIKKQDYKKSQEYNEAVLNYAIAFQDLEKELMALNNMAIIYSLQFDYRRAVESLLDALERSEEINFKAQVARCQINLGSIYAQLFNHQEAIKKYESVLKRFDQLLEKSTKVVLFNNLGNILYQQDDVDEALEKYQKAYDLASETAYLEMIPHSLAQMAKCNLSKSDYVQASYNTKEAAVMYAEKPQLSGWPIHLINEGVLLGQSGEHQIAIDKIKKGLTAAKTRKDPITEIHALSSLSDLYRRQGSLEKALEYLNQYVEVSRNYDLNKQGLQILDMEISYALKDKQKTIEQLIKDNEYKALLLKQSEKIADQNERLIEVNEELRQYAYITSHDLKEPLRMIKSFSKLILEKYKEDLDEEGKEYLSYIKEGSNRMDQLLDDLLKYTRIGSKKVEIEKVDLNEVMDIVTLYLKDPIEKSSANIICKTLPTISSNQSLLIQLLQNLILNAIKFQKGDTNPEIVIDHTEDEFSYQICVKDNGIGIPLEQQDRIFIIFQQLHAKNAFEGTGIGLAICKKISKKLGGEIWLESDGKSGSSFFFSIPKFFN